MKNLMIALCGLLLMASCASESNSRPSGGDSVNTPAKAELKKQKAIAREIVSIEHAALRAVSQLSNGDTAGFVAKVNALANRFDRVSQELDTVGPFPPELQQATLEKAKVEVESFARLMERQEATALLQIEAAHPEAALTIIPAMARYVSANSAVMTKAGLSDEDKKETGVEDANGQETNKP